MIHDRLKYLEGVTVCIDYADFLDVSLRENLHHFDEFVVVTSYGDRATQAVCARHGVTCVQTDLCYESGSAFNKGLPLGARLLHDEFGWCPLGFFQLWHSSARRRYPINQGSAEHTDVLFSCQWPAADRRLLPTAICYHLESEDAHFGANWNGRKTRRFAR